MAPSTAGGRRYALAPLITACVLMAIGLAILIASLPALAQSSGTSARLSERTVATISGPGQELDARGCYRDIARHRNCGQIVNCRLGYHYSVDGRDFGGSATLLRDCSELPEGTEIPVYYNPSAPKQSSLSDPATASSGGIGGTVLGGFLMVLGGGLGLALAAQRKRRNRESGSPSNL